MKKVFLFLILAAGLISLNACTPETLSSDQSPGDSEEYPNGVVINNGLS